MHLDQTGSSDKLKKIIILKSLSSFYLQIAQNQDPLFWNQTEHSKPLWGSPWDEDTQTTHQHTPRSHIPSWTACSCLKSNHHVLLHATGKLWRMQMQLKLHNRTRLVKFEISEFRSLNISGFWAPQIHCNKILSKWKTTISFYSFMSVLS